MVGVPGRSKGCSTCRKRKKGCDRKQPVCTQCSNAGLKCGGYQRDMVFINHTQVTKSGAVPVVYRNESRKRSGHPLGDVTDIALQNGLAQTAYIDKYISIFLMKYLPDGRGLTANRLGPSRDWMEIAHGLYTSDKAIQLSLLSLGLFAAGESQYAIQSYCFALRKLQTTLSVPFQAQNDSTLAVCQLFGLFEMFHGADENILSQGRKWRSHLSGLLALIQTRSPFAYQSGVSHQLFANARYPLLIAALKERRRFPLNTPEWRTIPWENEPKSCMDKLYDIIADMCGILADTDEMRRCNDPIQQAKTHAEILEACQCLDESLQGWFKEAGPLTDFHDSNGVAINPTGPSDLLLAHMTILYWTVYIILYSTLHSIRDPPLSEGVPADSNPAPYFRGVANALPYFWSQGAGMCGANLAAPLWGMCLQLIYGSPYSYPEETDILEQFVMQQSGASAILNFLDSLQRSTAGPEMANIDGREGLVLRARNWMMGKL
ncbi:hypothetical protein F4859DRAFT_486481 [Xylaria cf. heliscus]|nr:hypothetical protein F4859DRAFT_486481 [Xylaria cf. heliscus]